MRLLLSAEAAPDAPLDALLERAARRGLAGVELVGGVGTRAAGDFGTSGGTALSDSSAGTVAVLRLRSAAVEDVDSLARLATSLAAPVIVPGDGDTAVRLARRLLQTGCRTLLLLPPDPDAWLDRLDALGGVGALELAWEADPTAADLAGPAARLLDGAGSRLGHILLRGGGPEAAGQEGRGVGSLMARLAVAGFGGTVALAPSSTRYRVIWDAWLGRRGGWGCGSRDEDRSLVSLGGVV